jgi:hypothetical protein
VVQVSWKVFWAMATSRRSIRAEEYRGRYFAVEGDKRLF